MPRSKQPGPVKEVVPKRALGIVEALRGLPERELTRLGKELNVPLDDNKRIDDATQIARVVVGAGTLTREGALSAAERQLIQRLIEGRGLATFGEKPAAAHELELQGLLFCFEQDAEVTVCLPVALLLQLPTWDGEDSNSARSLLSRCAPGPAASIASYYLGRTATHPLKISLEPAWSALTDARHIREALRELAPAERDLLGQIEHLGGEVSTEELLDLEQEPLRLRTLVGTTPSRRGVGFALERRGFLIPLHPDRHVIPTEVLRAVGERSRQVREDFQAELRSLARDSQHEPIRARFCEDPTALAAGLALSLRFHNVHIKSSVGTPTSLVERMAQRFGAPVEGVRFLAALSRIAGLWEPSADTVGMVPGSLQLSELGARLYSVWLSGGGWNEALPNGETWRVADAERLRSPVAQLRMFVITALRELATDGWIPVSVIEQYVLGEHRVPGLERLLSRWSARTRTTCYSCKKAVRRILVESLFQLGCLDLATDEGTDVADAGSVLVRVSPLGKRLLRGSLLPPKEDPAVGSTFQDAELVVSDSATVSAVLSLGRYFDVASARPNLRINIDRDGVTRAVTDGIEPSELRARLEALAELSPSAERLFKQFSEVVGSAEYIPSAGFLWVADGTVRTLLATKKSTKALFVDPSPPGGLLLSANTDIETVTRRCRTLGVRIQADAGGATASVEEASADAVRANKSGTRRRVGRASSRAAKLGTG